MSATLQPPGERTDAPFRGDAGAVRVPDGRMVEHRGGPHGECGLGLVR